VTRKRGVVHWITGLPCVGKTVVGEALAERLRRDRLEVALLDGDAMRTGLAQDLGYSRRDRLIAAGRYSRLSRLLCDQGQHVVVCTVSMFAEVWEWNRRHLERYVEVYLVAPRSLRIARDRRGVYGGRDVPGEDLPIDEPQHPDVFLENDGAVAPAELAARIWAHSPLSNGRG